MKSFKNYLAEGRDFPLYHGTSLHRLEEIIGTGGIAPMTLHKNFNVMKTPIGHQTRGISTTRRMDFAIYWASEIVIELDQRKLAQTYQIIPVNYFYHDLNPAIGKSRRVEKTKFGDQNEPFAGKDTNNEYEEFIVTSKPIPLKYFKKVWIGKLVLPYMSEASLDVLRNAGIEIKTYAH